MYFWMRWVCPECEYTADVSYERLAEAGGPICEHCDVDMVLIPADTWISQWVARLEAGGVSPEDLDDLVHETAAARAADANNAGLEAQVEWLFMMLGIDEAERALQALIGQRPVQEKSDG